MARCVIEYTCHATATDCASAPRITATRANWYRLKSRKAKASRPRRGSGEAGSIVCIQVNLPRATRIARHPIAWKRTGLSPPNHETIIPNPP